MKKQHRLAVGLAVFLVLAVSGTAAGVLVDTAGHWAAPLVAALESKGVISGDSIGRFNPEAPLTRAEIAKMLVIGLGYEADAKLLAGYPSRFQDLPGSHWAKGYAESLAELAVTDGYPDGRFGPNDPVTRAQMATFLVRAAGLSDQARLMRFEPTRFIDDRDVPEWARGPMNMALSLGLFTGYEDRTLRPNRRVTRAEGSALLFRLLEHKGAMYSLTGTLIRFDPGTRRAVVRDSAGRERSVVMAPDAVYYREGFAVSPDRISRLDQIWLILSPDGTGGFMEARYADLLGSNPVLTRDSVTVTMTNGADRTLRIQPGAPVYLNGRPVAPEQVQKATEAYAALDVKSGEARVLDVINAPIRGTVTQSDRARSSVSVSVDGAIEVYSLAENALLFLNGDRTALDAVLPGDQVRLAADESGRITYLQAER